MGMRVAYAKCTTGGFGRREIRDHQDRWLDQDPSARHRSATMNWTPKAIATATICASYAPVQ